MQQLLKIDYTNIQSKTQLQDIVDQYKNKIQTTIKEIHQLNSFLSHETSQHELIIHKMQTIQQENNLKLQSLSQDISSIANQQQQLVKIFEKEKENIKKQLEQTHMTQVSQCIKKTQQLEIQYKNLKQWEEKQANYQKQIQNMRKLLIDSQYQHHDNMNAQEKRQKTIDDEVNQENITVVKEVKKNAHKAATIFVLQQKDHNEEQNYQLKTKLSELQIELSKLKKQRDEILVKRKQIKINTCLNEEQLQQYKAVGSIQKAKIKSYKDKIQNIKKVIETEVSKRETKINERKKERQNHLKTLKLKLHRLDKEKQQMKIAGEKLKLLGETILLQRAEVENFFIMAMENCRKEIESGQLKPIPEKQYGEKVDIEQLLPRDRQRIITNLYTKLALAPK